MPEMRPSYLGKTTFGLKFDPGVCRMDCGREATQEMSDVKCYTFRVCDECAEKFLDLRLVCKHCRVPVVSKEDTTARYASNPHKESCPRHVVTRHSIAGKKKRQQKKLEEMEETEEEPVHPLDAL
jgi:hypothetical protein